MTKISNRIKNAAAAVSLLLFGLLLAEIMLRLWGYRPWTETRFYSSHPGTTTKDDYLGWRGKPGVYDLKWEGRDLSFTILPNGERVTGEHSTLPEGKQLLVLGDSCIFGWAISDEDTLSWKLQKAFPMFNVRSLAQPGYGLLQNLLVLKKQIDAGLPPGSVIILGTAGFLADRDIASPQWVKTLSDLNDKSDIQIPFADLDENLNLVIHPAQWFWIGIPGRRHSSLLRLLEEIFAQMTSWRRIKQKQLIEDKLIEEFDQLAKEHQLRLIVMLWNPDSQLSYLRSFLSSKGIEAAECLHPKFPDKDTLIPGDIHPNEVVHHYWAECIAKYLEGPTVKRAG